MVKNDSSFIIKTRPKLKEVIHLLSDVPDEHMRLELIELLFTPNELEQLVARYEIIRNLIEGQKTQRDISASLKLSIAKITRGSNELKRISSELRTYLGDFFA